MGTRMWSLIDGSVSMGGMSVPMAGLPTAAAPGQRARWRAVPGTPAGPRPLPGDPARPRPVHADPARPRPVRSRRARAFALLAGIVVGLFGVFAFPAGAAQAHAALIRTSPVAGSIVSTAPSEIVITFSE